MAKKKKKKKKKKKLKKLSKKDLRLRRVKQAKQIKKLKKQRAKAKTPARKKQLGKQIKKKQQQRLKAGEVIERKKKAAKAVPGKQSLDQFYSSDSFKTLSPEQQQMLKEYVGAMDPASAKKFTELSKVEKKQIRKEVKDAYAKKYKKQRKRLDKDYEESLALDIQQLEREQENAATDLEEALANNDTYTAEQVRYYQRTLSDSLAQAKDDYEIEATRKNAYLATRLAEIREDMELGLGRISEDEAMTLKSLEHDYGQQLDALQTNMAQRGLAFSGIRTEAEAEESEEYQDLVTTASRAAQREREDIETESARQEYYESTSVAQDIEDALRRYGYSASDAIQASEQFLGTSGTTGLIGEDLQQYLIGEQTGALYKGQEDYEKEAQRTYQRGMESALDLFVGQYGTKKYKEKFGGRDLGLDYEPLKGIKGQYTKEYRRGRADIKEQRAADEALARQQLRGYKYLSRI